MGNEPLSDFLIIIVECDITVKIRLNEAVDMFVNIIIRKHAFMY